MKYLFLGLIMLLVIGTLSVVPSYASDIKISGTWETLCEKKLHDTRTTLDDFLCELDILGMYDNLTQLNGRMILIDEKMTKMDYDMTVYDNTVTNLNNTVMSFNGIMTTNSKEIIRLNAIIDEQLNNINLAFTPTPPTNLSVDRRVNAIALSWDAPLGFENSLYTVEYNDGNGWIVGESSFLDNTIIIENLTECVDYDFRVLAKNGFGKSDYTDIVTAMPYKEEFSSPYDLIVDRLSDDFAGIEWTWVECSRINGYWIEWNTSELFEGFSPGFGSSNHSNIPQTSITGLDSNTTYYTHVRNDYKSNIYIWSETISFTTLP